MIVFDRHVVHVLGQYCLGDLSGARSAAIRRHLDRCAACQREWEAVRRTVDAARAIDLTPAPEGLWARIEGELARDPRDHARSIPAPRSGWPRRRIAAAAVLFIALLYSRSRVPRPHGGRASTRTNAAAMGWRVIRLAGAPYAGSRVVRTVGDLRVGEWLQTDAASRARMALPGIGRVDVAPGSLVHLVASRQDGQRLGLSRGELTARVTAPPRIFWVDTPNGTAEDLGCVYTLSAGSDGGGILRVRLGWVAFVRGGYQSLAPAGASCRTRQGAGPGIPSFDDASPTFRAAIDALRLDGPPGDALDRTLGCARPRDSISLWHLLSRVPTGARGRVYDRLAGFVPPPSGCTRAALLRLDRTMLMLWGVEIAQETLDLASSAGFPADAIPPSPPPAATGHRSSPDP